jgi:hypothetical protein
MPARSAARALEEHGHAGCMSIAIALQWRADAMNLSVSHPMAALAAASVSTPLVAIVPCDSGVPNAAPKLARHVKIRT